MQCDCEAVECGHEPGSCKRVPSVKVEIFGMRENLCNVCLGIAQAFNDGEENDPGLQIVGPVTGERQR